MDVPAIAEVPRCPPIRNSGSPPTDGVSPPHRPLRSPRLDKPSYDGAYDVRPDALDPLDRTLPVRRPANWKISAHSSSGVALSCHSTSFLSPSSSTVVLPMIVMSPRFAPATFRTVLLRLPCRHPKSKSDRRTTPCVRTFPVLSGGSPRRLPQGSPSPQIESCPDSFPGCIVSGKVSER